MERADQIEVAPLDIETSAEIGKLFDALAKAQGEIKNAAKDAVNPHFKTNYADLASIADACRAPLAKNGIAVVQIPHNQGQDIAVTTIFGHSSGQWIRGRIAVRPLKLDAQGAGSVITYLRRYALAAMAGVAPEEDDGEGAAGRGQPAGNGGQFAAPMQNAAPKTAAPKAASNGEPWRLKAEDIKNAIDMAKAESALNKVMFDAGQGPAEKEPSDGSDLAVIKSKSESAWEFLVKRANEKRGVLAQRPLSTAAE